MKKVSIIIPIYNVEKYLEECIDSVLNQTYKNLEIILVNDGSPDNCAEICQKYLEKDNRIKYFYQKNQGVSVARNFGLSQSNGDYVYFMDSDDTINDIFIESSVEIAEKNNADIVHVATNVGRVGIENIDLYTLSTWEAFIRKNFLDKYQDLSFPIGIKNYEDSLFMHELLCLTDKVIRNDKAIYNYRRRGGQISSIVYKDKKYSLDLLPQWLDILEKFYTKYNLWNYKHYYLSLLISEICYHYWTNKNLTDKDKELFFSTIYDFVIKHNLRYFKSYNLTFHNFMAQRFIKCKKWQDFEKYILLRRILKFLKDIVRGIKNEK